MTDELPFMARHAPFLLEPIDVEQHPQPSASPAPACHPSNSQPNSRADAAGELAWLAERRSRRTPARSDGAGGGLSLQARSP